MRVDGNRPNPRRGLSAQCAALAFTACVAFAGSASAAEPALCAAFEGGCPGDAATLSEAEMGDMRGAYRGVLFGISFFGDATSLFNQTAATAPDGVSVEFTSDNIVQISAGLGTLPNGFSGVFQNTSVLGDFNTINNNLVINAIFLSDATDASAIFGF